MPLFAMTTRAPTVLENGTKTVLITWTLSPSGFLQQMIHVSNMAVPTPRRSPQETSFVSRRDLTQPRLADVPLWMQVLSTSRDKGHQLHEMNSAFIAG